MKNLILIALLAVSLCLPLFEAVANEDTSKSRVSIDIQTDGDSNDEFEQQIDSLVDLLSKFDKEAAEEVAVEIEGLSEDEKRELVEAFSKSKMFQVDHDDIPAGAIAIAVPAIFMIFGMPVFILIAILVYSHRRRRQKIELINAYISAGQPVPDNVMSSIDDSSSSGLLRSGIMLTAIGAGIVVAFSAGGNEFVAGIGCIPLFIGLGRILFWYLQARKEEQQVGSE